ncbi:MAG: hypothetical protein AB7S86_12090 [Hydrogenophaga sp.]
MPASYQPYEPQQQRLLPDALQAQPEGHPAYFVSDLEGISLNETTRRR